MLLAADLFEGILALVNPGGSPPPGTTDFPASAPGQRRGPRIAVTARLTVVPFLPGAEGLAGFDFPRDAVGSPKIPLGQPQSVPVRDVSRGGLRFLAPRRLPLDTPFVLLLPRPQGAGPKAADGSPLALECTVTYWQPIRKDLFAIGAQFHRILNGFVSSPQPPEILLAELTVPPVTVPLRAAV
jgi:hypothetical protein